MHAPAGALPFPCLVDIGRNHQSGTGRCCSCMNAWQTLHVQSPGDSIPLREMTSSRHLEGDVRSTPSQLPNVITIQFQTAES